ncbi:hypothetical protein PHYBLDRAFT_64133 [Phycomyces blakesleeanus NRRL 1555(-)]|uniref:Uncharacterized protein n=1 Tax=Phycomyces blakesleeanus (strain ATCC 8743b / DSM 1359 / FGSC 10004 / NBRC 33097 / NRRL 1555) TaxID=763407 RepID=A0A167LNB5_PHYB8|nr:hypothetical protein PHYBLDRAFT_64133 [Phycomyces blakesleeanus NRRL 1555(-)]OAD70788.1 hypothetical protein PHYBLDRAFT_64133 [Phycomyces blakesleeanus NRRL 1555(-)]|eukprot:XP_018288828.1 hypothetical protein PHYBLDRAFT_64133 [Phycomyces blakesleeanus NRRL 1555(-)]
MIKSLKKLGVLPQSEKDVKVDMILCFFSDKKNVFTCEDKLPNPSNTYIEHLEAISTQFICRELIVLGARDENSVESLRSPWSEEAVLRNYSPGESNTDDEDDKDIQPSQKEEKKLE